MLPQRWVTSVIMARSARTGAGGSSVAMDYASQAAVSSKVMTALPELPGVASLQLLDFSCGSAPAPSAAALSSALSALTLLQCLHIDLQGSVWRNATELAAACSGLPALSKLHLSAAALPPPTRGGGDRSGISMAALFLPQMPRINSLCLVNCLDEGADIDAAQLLRMLELPPSRNDYAHLRCLRLAGPELGGFARRGGGDAAAVSACDAMFAKLRHASALQHLSLSGAALGCERFAVAAGALPPLQELTHLELARNRLKRDGIAHLPALLNATTALRHLDLSENSLRDLTDVGLVPALGALTALEALVLSNTVLQQRGAQALASVLTNLTALQHLDLSENGIPEQVSS